MLQYSTLMSMNCYGYPLLNGEHPHILKEIIFYMIMIVSKS